MVLAADGVQRLHRGLRRAEEQRPGDLVDADAGGHVDLRGPAASRASAFVSTAIRRMNSSAASTTPTVTAITMSNTTVSTKQVSSTMTSLRGAIRSEAHEVARLGHVPRDDEQQRRRARPSAGTTTSGASAIVHARTKTACIAAASGERAPARMFVAVRASAPVAAMPPKNGHTMLRDAERDQLGVRIVLGAGHAVGDDRGQQRLDRAEHRDRERRRQQLADHLRSRACSGRRSPTCHGRPAAAAAAGCRRRPRRRSIVR